MTMMILHQNATLCLFLLYYILELEKLKSKYHPDHYRNNTEKFIIMESIEIQLNKYYETYKKVVVAYSDKVTVKKLEG